MRAGSAFTGICGFERGFEQHGIETVCAIEWDKHCQRVIREHYPDLPLMEDICDVRGSDINDDGIDLWHGGFPCQDTSIAAPHRSGLDGRRSSNFYEFTRLLTEYAEIVDDTRPRWVAIENPDGLLKSREGRDMGTVVGTLVDLGYGVAWRVVDGGRLGTAQRRLRLIILGHRGGDPRPARQVLGDGGAGTEAAPARDLRRDAPRLRVVRDPAEDAGELKIWRKSARARKAISAGGYETWVSDGRANTLTGFDGGLATRQTHLLRQHGRLRTLTLTEWERLQGFPDDWTAMIPESARFQALGNAMHVGTSAWLARRLVAVHNSLPQLGVA